tara:strand:+ start:105 stop:1073 length:969 start_codon:yes stop_codon:yes gene_type:complete
MKKTECAPNRSNQTVSCFKKKELDNIANVLNKKIPELKINIKSNKKKLWNDIRTSLIKITDTQTCVNEWCWLKTCLEKNEGGICKTKMLDLLDKDTAMEMLMYTFKPPKPSGKKTLINGKESDSVWLSTTDILFVMKQYEKIYDKFTFFGPVPIDFQKCTDKVKDHKTHETVNNWCGNMLIFNLAKMELKANTAVGIVFNLDKHNEPGSHWTSMFIDMKNSTIEYFDSYGIDEIACKKSTLFNFQYDTPDEVNKLMDKLSKKHNLTKKINRKRHQWGDSECGIYSMYFILERLRGRSFEDITNTCISDKKMNEYRDIFFRKK